MEKTFNFKIVILPNDTPQKWEFIGISGIEQLAIWTIIENLAKKEKEKLLNAKHS